MKNDETSFGAEKERRRYFRIDDWIGLKIISIPAQHEEQIITEFNQINDHQGIVDELRDLRATALPQRHALENRYPIVAAYLTILERQIEILAFIIDSKNEFPNAPNNLVTLSAQGLSFITDQLLAAGSLVELYIVLFPDRCRIKTLARVISPQSDERQDNIIALEFLYLRDVDREAIIQHVQNLQRKKIQINSSRK